MASPIFCEHFNDLMYMSQPDQHNGSGAHPVSRISLPTQIFPEKSYMPQLPDIGIYAYTYASYWGRGFIGYKPLTITFCFNKKGTCISSYGSIL